MFIEGDGKMKGHEKISLEDITKSFEYEKIVREIDEISDVESLKDIAKSYIKLYFKQQEVLSQLNFDLTNK